MVDAYEREGHPDHDAVVLFARSSSATLPRHRDSTLGFEIPSFKASSPYNITSTTLFTIPHQAPKMPSLTRRAKDWNGDRRQLNTMMTEIAALWQKSKLAVSLPARALERHNIPMIHKAQLNVWISHTDDGGPLRRLRIAKTQITEVLAFAEGQAAWSMSGGSDEATRNLSSEITAKIEKIEERDAAVTGIIGQLTPGAALLRELFTLVKAAVEAQDAIKDEDIEGEDIKDEDIKDEVIKDEPEVCFALSSIRESHANAAAGLRWVRFRRWYGVSSEAFHGISALE